MMENPTKEIWNNDITEENYGLYFVLTSAIFFFILSKVVLFLTPTLVLKSSWRWKNICTSLIHSIMSSVWVVLCFYERPDMAEDLITVFTPLSHTLSAVSVGYFVHDFMDLMINQRTKQSFELLGHHVVVVVCFTVVVLWQHYVGYTVVALMVEVNSIFLHLRQLMQIFGVSKYNPWYRLNSIITLATFIVFRILLLAWMTRWIVINKNAVPIVFYTMGSVGLAVMIAMNIVLFYRLLRSDFISVKDIDSTSQKGE